ncbi:MAG: ThuA domain-containing protein [Pirellulales bacterium]
MNCPRSISSLRVVSTLVLLACAVGLVIPRLARAAEPEKPIRALLVVGGCCHDYARQKELLTKGISARANVEWTIAYDPDTTTKHANPVYDNPDWAKGFDVVVHDECSADVTDAEFIKKVLKPHREGVPAVLVHCGMHSYRGEGYPKATEWFDFTGLASTGHGPQAPIDVHYVDPNHPVTKGLADWKTIKEELYNNSAGKLHDTAHALAEGTQVVTDRNGQTRTDHAIIAWTNLYNDKTRVFSTTLGHNNDTVGDDRYLDLITQGLLWAVGREKP